MKNLNILISLTGFLLLTACGGGGGGGGGGQVAIDPLAKPTGPHDTDDTRPIGFNAVNASEVEHSSCMPSLPSFEDFNTWADREASQPPLINPKFIMSNVPGNEVGVSLFRQNQKLSSALGALVFQGKELRVLPSGGLISGGMIPIYDKAVYEYVPTNCETISCVGEAVFSRTYGARLYYRQTYGILISEFADERILSGFNGDDRLESALYAVATLPRNMLPIPKSEFFASFSDLSENIILSTYERGYKEPGAPSGAVALAKTMVSSLGTYVDANIYLFDGWQEQREYFERVYIVFHELVHTFDRNAAISGTKEWHAMSKWTVDKDKYKIGDDSKACSIYGTTSPQEDLAECGALYRFAPLRLKAISLEKYNYIKNKVFGGIEFLEPRTCVNYVEDFVGI